MGNTVIINTIDLSPHAFLPLGGGGSALERVFQWAQSLPEVEEIVFLAPQEGDEPLPSDASRIIRLPRWGEREFLETLIEAGRGREILFYVYGDTPLLDRELSVKLLENHRHYYAQYSFADGYPYGLTPEIVSAEILPSLLKLTTDENPEVDRTGLFTIIGRDINSFDVETEIAPRDMRLLRISLTADCGRNHLLLQGLFEEWETVPGADEISRILEEKQELLRTLPAFAEIQVTNRLGQRVSYLPEFPGTVFSEEGADFIDAEAFESILDKLERLSGGDMTLNIGFRGEAAFHPKIADLVARVLARPGFKLLMETSGIGWSDAALSAMALLDRSRIDWIVTLDSLNPESYGALRGEGFEESLALTEKLESLFPGRWWVQATRLQGGEDDLEAFYRHWKERGDRSIIQKYDWFCGLLPERKVTDLSPLTRFPCWHLKRDIPILLDGTVLTCREDLTGDSSLGNLLTDDPEVLWEKGNPLYREHLRNSFPGICGRCDEYYTFNF